MIGRQYDYVNQLTNTLNIVNESIDLPKSVELVTALDNRFTDELNYKTLSNQNWELFGGSLPIYASDQQSLNEPKAINDRKKTKTVFIKGEFPKEIRRNNYEKVINDINQNFVSEWQNIKELIDKDIDVTLSFEGDPESSDFEMTYTIYVMDLHKNDVEIVWNKLRKLFNEVINNIKHNQPRYRRKLENLEKLAVIHIEW
jgi:hypothetical protein